MPRTHPRPPRPRWLLIALLALVLSSCTFRSGSHLELDFLGARYRFYLYEKPSAQLAVELRAHCRATAGTSRRSWARCSLTFLHDLVEVPSIGTHDWGVFTGLDQWDDYGGAVDDVIAAGFGFDGRGQRYARACLVGDHAAFSDYNWTTRAASDVHCKRGENAP